MADLSEYQEVLMASQPNDNLLDHIGLVKRVALHLKTRLPNFMELEELIQVGTIGLIEAAKSFDESKDYSTLINMNKFLESRNNFIRYSENKFLIF